MSDRPQQTPGAAAAADPLGRYAPPGVSRYESAGGPGRPARGDSLVDLLDRVLDKGVVIAGDVSISLLDIELLTIKIRLLIASVDKAKEMGIDWWERDPALSSRAGGDELEERVRRLERAAGVESGTDNGGAREPLPGQAHDERGE